MLSLQSMKTEPVCSGLVLLEVGSIDLIARAHPERVWEILHEGAKKARKVAGETMKDVRSALKLPAPEEA